MNVRYPIERLRRVLSKSPAYVAARLWSELGHSLARYTLPALGRRFDGRELARRTGAADSEAVWLQFVRNVAKCFPEGPAKDELERLVPGEVARILAAAEAAMRNEIDLLGSGPVCLGTTIDWHRDYVTGDSWPLDFFRRIDYLNVGRPSDVKRAWELSRLQWLLPCAQAWRLTGDERYAHHVREVLEQWIDGNPFACGVNWAVAMEPAIRILSWSWLLRACADSESFSDRAFRQRFMQAYYLHGLFIEKFLERSDVNGNHFTADAVALVVAGVVVGSGDDAARWRGSGERDIAAEITRQVHPDGVDFEASSSYHRLVAELFLLAAIALRSIGREVGAGYRQRLIAMAEFTAAYSRPDGLAPLWGDNDDARALPLGTQSLRDHRYLVGLIGLHFGDAGCIHAARGSRAEAAWLLGPGAAAGLAETGASPGSKAFRDGGAYVLRDGDTYVFIDCGPIGLAGRGGHGHNDLLSFEATVGGIPLVSEGGCFVYTGDDESRHIDRSTGSHNTPIVDEQEVNRFIGPEFRWNMHDDARHEVIEFLESPEVLRFRGRHTGYCRLQEPVVVERIIEIVRGEEPVLRIVDEFPGEGSHRVRIPLHLGPGCEAREVGPGRLSVSSAGREFEISWDHRVWKLAVGQGREAASYGRQNPVVRLEWSADGVRLSSRLEIRPSPAQTDR